MNFEQIRQFFRDNPRMWGAVAVALIALVAVGWWAWGGSNVQLGQSSAEDTCTGSGAGFTCAASSSCVSPYSVDSSKTCTGTGRVCCKVPIDPAGNCLLEFRDNAPNGGWFCKELKCRLNGNGFGNPPSGPASSLSVKVYREIVLPPDGTDKLHIRTVLDATPKCSGGGECYPPEDPLWTCDGPMWQGRDGSDKFDCYNPIIHRTDYGPITCCANTGLSDGDCFTWNYTTGAPTPTATPTPTPTPTLTITPSPSPSISVAPLQCAPSTQTVDIGEVARVQATGGTGIFTWTTNGGGVQDDGGSDFVVYSYSAAGSKIVTVKSGGLTAFCTVVVGSSPATTATPGTGSITAVKQGRNVTLGQTDFFPTVSVDANQVVQFQFQIKNSLTTPASVIVRDNLPTGTSYKPGTTMINNSPVGDGITDSGIPVSLTPSQETVIKWGVVADRTDLLGSGDNLLYPKTDIITPSGVVSADMLVNITGTGDTSGAGGVSGAGTGTSGTSGAGAGGVSTGPGDAVVLALIGSAIVTLLYTAYTRSPSFRRKEVEHIARDRDPLDFRG